MLISDAFEIPQLNKTRKLGFYFRMIMTAQKKVILLCIYKMHKNLAQ
jgi:hypothetical protein